MVLLQEDLLSLQDRRSGVDRSTPNVDKRRAELRLRETAPNENRGRSASKFTWKIVAEEKLATLKKTAQTSPVPDANSFTVAPSAAEPSGRRAWIDATLLLDAT